MSKFQQKLKENKNKIKREKFLASVDRKLSAFLANVEYSDEISCIKFAAFPRWDDTAQAQTTTRGDVKNWNYFSFRTWQELIAVLKRFQQVKNYIGWFFIDADGPYYRISLNAFLANIRSISEYCSAHGNHNFGWVGDIDDVGIIIGENSSPPGSHAYTISIWGI